MAFNEQVAQRIRDLLANTTGISEKQMFGGIAFLHHGNMFCGVESDDLMLRVGELSANKVLKQAHVREMDFTGRPLKNYIYVSAGGFRTAARLSKWITLALDFVGTLPRKKK